MSDALGAIAEAVTRATGIRIGPERRGALRAAIARAAPGTDAAAFARLVGDPATGAMRRLIDEVTVQETYFFRECAALESLDWRGLYAAAAAEGRQAVRVWVAACATGEEAYTLAMLAHEAFAPMPPAVTILATDVSDRALERAAAGVYTARSVRAVSAARRRRWLRPEGGRFAVSEPLRRVVRFRQHNLVHDAVPPLGEEPFDIVTCRNVLIYFDLDTAHRVREALDRAVQPAGALVLGTADVLVGTGRRAPPPPRAAELRGPRAPRHAPAPAAPEAKTRHERLAHGLRAAAEGRARDALAHADALLAADALDADAHFLRGFVEFAGDHPEAAVGSLRRALYVDPSFGLAAFLLGRAHDAAGRPSAAVRAYERALRTLGGSDERHVALLEQVDLDDVAAACRARVDAARDPRAPSEE